MRGRLAIVATVLSVFIVFSYILLPSREPVSINSPLSTDSYIRPTAPSPPPDAAPPLPPIHVAPGLLQGDTIMPKLANETLKQELGRAAWKVFHTTLARFPKKPTPDEREALSSYIHLSARLYPCGECATHFRLILQQYPPQTSSRDAASQWGCFIHNLVNQRLGKEVFDCGTVTETYQCGCADADAEKEAAIATATEPKGAEDVMRILEENARKAGKGARVEIEKSGLTNGG